MRRGSNNRRGRIGNPGCSEMVFVALARCWWGPCRCTRWPGGRPRIIWLWLPETSGRDWRDSQTLWATAKSPKRFGDNVERKLNEVRISWRRWRIEPSQRRHYREWIPSRSGPRKLPSWMPRTHRLLGDYVVAARTLKK